MNELLFVGLMVVNFAAIIAMYRVFGKTGLYVWMPISVILANIQVVKTITILGITATLGNVVYATSFLVTDILSENYGKGDARRAVFIGFASLVAMTGIMYMALLFKPAPEDFAHESLVTIFSVIPRIAAASIAAYLISQLHDVWAFHLWKRIVPGKRSLWLRNNASTFISQLIDSVVFTTAAFAGLYAFPVLVEIAITTYLLKLFVAVFDTPLVYLSRRLATKNSD